jgi:succinoglycan biosynthesis transport protein ExoP
VTINQFIRILRARWILALGVLLFIVTMTLIVSLILPKNFKATATIVVDMKPDPASGLPQMSSMQPAGFLATQSDIIQSAHVAQRVVRELRLAESAQSRQQWLDTTGGKGNYEAWLGELIGKSLSVDPARESNVIEITYKSVDPAFSAVMANTFAKAYMESLVQMRVDPARGYSDYFEERGRMAREKLEKSQSRLAAAQKEKNIIATDERLDVETAKLNELSTQLVVIRGLLADSGSRTAQSRGRAEQTPDVLNNALISNLKADLSRQQARLEELSARYGDNHPLVIELKANIAETSSKIRSEVQRVTGSFTVSNDINKSREAAAIVAYEEQRAKLLKMKEQRSELSVLEKEVDSNQRIYDAIQFRQSQMNIEGNASQSNVFLLSPATEPADPSSPKILINMLVASVVGTLLAILTTFVYEMSDRRVRCAFDVVQGLDLPVIGIMPRPDAARRLWGKKTVLPWGENFLLNKTPHSDSRSIDAVGP